MWTSIGRRQMCYRCEHKRSKNNISRQLPACQMSLQVTRTTIISSFEYSMVSDSRCSTVAFVAARLTDKSCIEDLHTLCLTSRPLVRHGLGSAMLLTIMPMITWLFLFLLVDGNVAHVPNKLFPIYFVCTGNAELLDKIFL
jgi:hypothetical protein